MRLLQLSALAALVVLSSFLLWRSAQAQEAESVTSKDPGRLTPQEQQGKQIYLTGESPAGEPITALMGESSIEVPASTLPCGNCHGRDGKGNPEGGVTPTDLTWPALTKPYGVRHESGREHPPYTVSLLKRAIAMGFDPAGNELHVAMPRYRMTLGDMEALVAYLQRLGADPDPGVTTEALHLGTLLPPQGQATGIDRAIQAVLDAFVAEVNQRGGLYGRRLILHTHRLARDPAERRAGVETFLDTTPVFALAGAFLAGSEQEITTLVAEREVPLIGPFTLHPQTGFPINRQVFYLLAGLATQGRVLVDFAAERHPSEETVGEGPTAVVVFSPGDAERALEAMESQAKLYGWQLQRRPLPSAGQDGMGLELARELGKEGVERLFLLHPLAGDPEFLAALPSVELYVPGAFVTPALLESAAASEGRLFLVVPSLPADQTPQAMTRYRRLAETYDLPQGHRATQLATLAATEVLLEGLKQAGRDVSREKLIAALETLYEHRTGMLPPITYNPNRRVGAEGAYVMALDAKIGSLRPVGGFREPVSRR